MTAKAGLVYLCDFRCDLLVLSMQKNVNLSRHMRKPTICLVENKGEDQLRSNCEADQRLCFRYTDSTIPLLLKIRNFKLLALFCDCTGRFVSDLFESHIVGFPTRRLNFIIIILSFRCPDNDRGSA